MYLDEVPLKNIFKGNESGCNELGLIRESHKSNYIFNILLVGSFKFP